MAKQAKSEPKEMKLVCKCGDCRHWEIILVRDKGAKSNFTSEYIQCMSCGVKVTCYFSVGPHEGLHYERHVKGDVPSPAPTPEASEVILKRLLDCVGTCLINPNSGLNEVKLKRMFGKALKK